MFIKIFFIDFVACLLTGWLVVLFNLINFHVTQNNAKWDEMITVCHCWLFNNVEIFSHPFYLLFTLSRVRLFIFMILRIIDSFIYCCRFTFVMVVDVAVAAVGNIMDLSAQNLFGFKKKIKILNKTNCKLDPDDFHMKFPSHFLKVFSFFFF